MSFHIPKVMSMMDNRVTSNFKLFPAPVKKKKRNYFMFSVSNGLIDTSRGKSVNIIRSLPLYMTCVHLPSSDSYFKVNETLNKLYKLYDWFRKCSLIHISRTKLREFFKLITYHLGKTCVLPWRAQPRLTWMSLNTVFTVLTLPSAPAPLTISILQKSFPSPLPFYEYKYW